MELRLNFQMIVFISNGILSENLLNETRKIIQCTKNDVKVAYRQYATKLFSVLRLLLFSVIDTFEKSLYNDDT